MAPDVWLFFLLFQDPRFNSEVDKATGYKTHSILCMPIKSHDGEVPVSTCFFPCKFGNPACKKQLYLFLSRLSE